MRHLEAWLRLQNNSSTHLPLPSPSHVFLNGGKVYLSDTVETRKAFLDAYASDVVAGTLLYVVERTDASYRMFADFDILLEKTRLPTTHLPTLIDYALSFFPAHLRGDVVSICVREAHGGKVGAHMIWRDLRVDDAGARSIRDAWVAALKDADAADSDWDETIDAAVYRRNGLRMPWSRKRDDISGIGVYKPTHTWTLEGSLMPWTIPKTHAEVLDALERCSILSTSAPPPPLPEFETSPSSPTSEPSSRTRTRTRTRTRIPPPLPEAEAEAKGITRSVIRDALIYMGLDETSPTRIHTDDPGRCILFSCMPPSRACRIAGREHRSNHIYHQMLWDPVRNEWHLRQRCHSSKCADRYCSLGYILQKGHAETTRAASSTQRAIATMADRWMAKMHKYC